MLFLSACSQEIITFSGKSENWDVQYELLKDNTHPETKGSIRFIGTEPIPERIEFTIYDTSGNVHLDKNGVYILGKCIGCHVPDALTEIEAIIDWDNKSETIFLEVESK